MKSERLVSLLLLLQARSPRSARELAQSLEVSMRTIYRDVDTLGLSGIPVYAERGNGGGIALSDGYRRTIAQFSTNELHGLFASASDPLADLGLTGHTLALHKIEGTLPALQRSIAEKARQRIFLDHSKWYRPPQPSAVLGTLRSAVWEDMELSIVYRDRGGSVSDRIIEPLGLVAKAGVWYVVARAAGDMRSFRADRIVRADETGARFARPSAFDLESYWRSAMGELERAADPFFEALLLVQADALEMLSPYFQTELVEDGEIKRVKVRFPSFGVAESQIMMLGNRVHDVEPTQLREAVARRARALAELLEAHPVG